MAGDIDLESAAADLQRGGDFGLFFEAEEVTPADRVRIEDLFGRVLWLALQESDPANVPETPFGSAEVRQMAEGVFFDADSEEPSQQEDIGGALDG